MSGWDSHSPGGWWLAYVSNSKPLIFDLDILTNQTSQYRCKCFINYAISFHSASENRWSIQVPSERNHVSSPSSLEWKILIIRTSSSWTYQAFKPHEFESEWLDLRYVILACSYCLYLCHSGRLLSPPLKWSCTEYITGFLVYTYCDILMSMVIYQIGLIKPNIYLGNHPDTHFFFCPLGLPFLYISFLSFLLLPLHKRVVSLDTNSHLKLFSMALSKRIPSRYTCWKYCCG